MQHSQASVYPRYEVYGVGIRYIVTLIEYMVVFFAYMRKRNDWNDANLQYNAHRTTADATLQWKMGLAAEVHLMIGPYPIQSPDMRKRRHPYWNELEGKASSS